MPFLRLLSRLVAVSFAACLAAVPARAELVVLVSGEVLKVRSFDANGLEARLEMPSGGFLTLSIDRVERVLADEIAPPAEPEPETTTAAIELGFIEGQGIPGGTFGGLAYWAAKRHGVNPELVAAVVRAESNWNPRAVSRKGACGLMQIMPATGRRYGLQRADLFDIEKNLDAGSRYLAWLAERFGGDLPRVLAAYNAGEGTVDRYGGVPPYRETREYIRRIYGYLGLEDQAVVAVAEPPSASRVTAAR